jgi:hypothetical protein
MMFWASANRSGRRSVEPGLTARRSPQQTLECQLGKHGLMDEYAVSQTGMELGMIRFPRRTITFHFFFWAAAFIIACSRSSVG